MQDLFERTSLHVQVLGYAGCDVLRLAMTCLQCADLCGRRALLNENPPVVVVMSSNKAYLLRTDGMVSMPWGSPSIGAIVSCFDERESGDGAYKWHIERVNVAYPEE